MADLQVGTPAVNGGSSLTACFTDRHSGTSRAPYDEANLALHVGDDPLAVAENRTLLRERLGAPVVWMQQVHGADVAIVEGPRGEPVRDVDALVTAARDVALAVLVADCVPVLLHDAEAGVLGVAHAGRRGLAAGVAVRTVETMAGLGADPDRTRAWLGPSICGRCYEVPLMMRTEVDAAAPGCATTTSRGTPGIDLRAGLRHQLLRLGLHGSAVRDVGTCTAETRGLFSHRRDGVTGRFAGVALMHP